MQAGLDYDGSENEEPVSDEIHLMRDQIKTYKLDDQNISRQCQSFDDEFHRRLRFHK